MKKFFIIEIFIRTSRKSMRHLIVFLASPDSVYFFPTLSRPVPGSLFNSNQEMTEQQSRYVNIVSLRAGKENEMKLNRLRRRLHPAQCGQSVIARYDSC